MGRLPPLAWAALALAAGVAVGARFGPHPLAGLVGAPLAAAALVRSGAAGAGLALFAAAGVALGVGTARRPVCTTHIPDGARVEARGVLEAVPGGGAVGFRLEAVRGAGGGWIPCVAEARLRLPRQPAPPPPGLPLRVQGEWRAPDPGKRGMRGLLLADVVARDPGGQAHEWVAARGRLQIRIRKVFGEGAPLAEALLVARKEAIEPELRDRFAASGLSHLLAISGLHVGLVAAGLLLLTRLLRVPGRTGALVAAVATTGYVAFLGAPYAAVRAATQALLLLAGGILQRPAHPAALLSAAAVLVLAADPGAALDVGCQLSFAGVAGLIWMGERFRGALEWVRWAPLRDLLAASLAATVATSPITAFHFGQIAPVGILANLVAIPLVGLIVPALGLALAVSFVSWPLAEFLAGGAEILLRLLTATAAAAAAIPGGHMAVPRSEPVRWAVSAVAGLLVVGWLAGGAGHRSRRDPSRPGLRPAVRWIAVAGVAITVMGAWPGLARRPAGTGLTIHMIDVGQGDAFAIRSPAGRWILVDAGPRSERFDAGRSRVVPFLLDHGVQRLEAFVLTHPDADHIGGAAAVLGAVDVAWIVDPGLAAGKPMYLDLLRDARERGVPWAAARAGRTIEFDGVVLTILFPGGASLDEVQEANAFSVVFRLEYGRFSALFTGDAPAELERLLVEEHGAAMRSTVLKVGHHGSRTSTSAELLDAVRPQWALVSAGRHNRYGHPAPDVLERLHGAGVRVLRADRNGTMTLHADAAGRVEVGGERCSSDGCYAP